MKKIVGTIAAIALAASSAFAGVGIGGWGRGIWAPVAGQDGNIVTFEAASWGPINSNIRTGISIGASSDNVGFNIDMNADNAFSSTSCPGIGDTAFIWVKPADWLYLAIGKVQDIAARGDGCFGQFGWWRQANGSWTGSQGYGMAGEDLTFKRFGDGKGSQANGAIVKVTPIDGLWIEAALNLGGSSFDTAENVYSKGQYGAGYVIDGIGHIRAQYIGATNSINAAFDLTAVENLFVTVGANIGLDNGADTNVAAYVKYNISAVTIHALFNGTLATNKFGFEAAAGLDYDFGNGIGATADVRFYNTYKAPPCQ